MPVVGAAIVDQLRRPTRLLAAQRSGPPALAGRWEFPGGKVRDGETWALALHRELHEELAVRVRLGRPVPGPLPDGCWPLPRGFRMAVWLAQISSGTPTASAAHTQLRWVTAADLAELDWLPGDLPILAALPLRAGPTGTDRRGRSGLRESGNGLQNPR